MRGPTMPADPDTQHALFAEAVILLGGSRATARLLDIHERSVLRLLNRTHPLHDGFLRDISAALTDLAQRCRELERRLSPMFEDNLVADPPREDRRRTRYHEEG